MSIASKAIRMGVMMLMLVEVDLLEIHYRLTLRFPGFSIHVRGNTHSFLPSFRPCNACVFHAVSALIALNLPHRIRIVTVILLPAFQQFHLLFVYGCRAGTSSRRLWSIVQLQDVSGLFVVSSISSIPFTLNSRYHHNLASCFCLVTNCVWCIAC